MKLVEAPESESKRPYRQGARARAAAQTAETIVRNFSELLERDWYDDISLERIAKDSGVTVPTVLRHFGSKEGLLEAVAQQIEAGVMVRRAVAPGDVDGAIRAIVEDYDAAGDMMMRMLAQEERIPAMRQFVDKGRAHHRNWVAKCFSPWLEGRDQATVDWRLDGLVVALDLYTWKILRRDRERSAEDVRQFMKQLVCGILGPDLRTD